jgi:hypothetical protein
MNQKSSLREVPQFVSKALTANRLGIAAAPYAYGGYGYGDPYYGYDSYAYGGCYTVRQWTPWGPRLVQVCN